ncbi:hypothetical protein [Leptolinea tardivitalis]|uniref:Uncharacterized protein n=1 Tax=Leptolinea tardivitalis TaxID=229920 RepID=A0A0P6XCI5_9CHLR|nr:hypothetical protein [Leptolinea tardivitalis]KPL72948.1 hypothetical protein ADM99_07910 [Leptolinea tardivitalis]GAP20654.1 hypothetical protein LTAR_00848 [Leptolinea tardivitalis]
MTLSNEEQTPPQNNLESASEAVPSQPLQHFRRQIRNGLILSFLGFAIFLLGARPSVYGLDRSPVIGFVQIGMFILGIGIMSLGAYVAMKALWKGKPTSIISQIGTRLMATGFVIIIFTGLADVFGLGSHRLPKPFFGPLQSTGVQIGEFVIGVGIILMLPFHRIFPGYSQKIKKSEKDNGDSEYQ